MSSTHFEPEGSSSGIRTCVWRYGTVSCVLHASE